MSEGHQDGFFIVTFEDLTATTVDQGEADTEEERYSCERSVREDVCDTRYDHTFE